MHDESAPTNGDQPWEFAGWGNAERLTGLGQENLPVEQLDQAETHLLGA
ncbi:MAG: hypothetical protein WCE62_18475 [Polyangiales bacterium]